MHDARWSQLKELLVEQGWSWRDDALYAPHETMWFQTSVDDPDLALFRERMTTTRDLPIDQRALHDDLVTLVAALDAVLGN